MPTTQLRSLLLPVVVSASALALTPLEPAAPAPWGEVGHRLAARSAASGLPGAMPAFFRDAAGQLEYLDPEPDRWRSRELNTMDQAFAYDHYIDLENVPARALDAPHRWEFVRLLYEAGVEVPERDAGFLPYRVLELYERLLAEWRLWRENDGPERAWIEQRIINDAGVLGHYVTDASQPHHTTIHYNGWADDAPNPAGYTTERDFHWRFESAFVAAHVDFGEVLAATRPGAPRHLADTRAAVLDYLLAGHREVETLYRLEKEARFDPETSPPTAHLEFAVDRLAVGASMLRDLWWTAWLESAVPEADVRGNPESPAP